MPIYEFECEQCGHKWEELSPMGVSVARCPKCEALAPRIPSVSSPHFKGEGWTT
jgi:putative FmdB family regulatory protein